MEAENAEAKNGDTEVTIFECFLKRFAVKISAKTREKYSQVKCPTSEQGSALK